MLLKYKNIIISLVVNSLCFGLILQFFAIRFMTNDDVRMMLWASGMSQVKEPTEFLLFTHIYIGKILNLLYSFSLHVPWYTCYLLISVWLGMVSFYYILLKRQTWWLASGIFLFFIICVGIPLIQEIQFTSVAGFLCVVGLLGLLENLLNPKNSGIFEKIILSLLIIWGSFIRLESFILCFIIFLVFSFSFVFIKKIKAKSLIIFCLSISIIVGGLYWIHFNAYKQNPMTQEFFEFNDARAEINDYLTLEQMNPEEKKSALSKANWDYTDYQLLMSWVFYDKSVYNVKSMNNSCEANSKLTSFKLKNISQAFTNLTASCFVCFFMIVGLMLFGVKKYLWQIIALLFIIFLLSLYSLIYLKPFTDYIWKYCLLFLYGPLLVQTFYIEKSDFRVFRLLLFAFFAILFSIRDHLNKNQTIQQNAIWVNYEISHLKQFNNATFLICGNSFPWEFIDPFKETTDWKDLKTFVFGTSQQMPLTRSTLNTEVETLDQLLSQKSYYLIDDNKSFNRLTLLQQYIANHYNKQITFKEVRRNDVFTVYSMALFQN